MNGEVAGVVITGIALDSRQVKPGQVFVCLSGGNTDGHHYIGNAIQQGAAAVLGTQPIEGLSVPYLRVEDARKTMAYVAAAFYGLALLFKGDAIVYIAGITLLLYSFLMVFNRPFIQFENKPYMIAIIMCLLVLFLWLGLSKGYPLFG